MPVVHKDENPAILTDYEKKIVYEELNKVKRGRVNLDADGDTSLSMIHMIFQFYLQSGEYPFFIKRIKNIAQSKMGMDGDR